MTDWHFLGVPGIGVYSFFSLLFGTD